MSFLPSRICAWLPVLVMQTLLASAAFGQASRVMLQQAWIEPHVGAQVPATVRFNDHLGQPTPLAALLGERPTVLCLVYFECPMLCKLTADGLIRAVASVPQHPGSDYNIAFVSFDPRDTPERAAAARTHALSQYGKESDGKGWYFLTGQSPAIHQLTDAVGFHYVWDETTKQFAHASGIVVLAPDGTIAQYLDGVQFSPKQLSAAIDSAAAKQLTPQAETSFVRCYLYDPTTGRFGSAVKWTLRGLGVLTVLVLAATTLRLSGRRASSSGKSPTP